MGLSSEERRCLTAKPCLHNLAIKKSGKHISGPFRAVFAHSQRRGGQGERLMAQVMSQSRSFHSLATSASLRSRRGSGRGKIAPHTEPCLCFAFLALPPPCLLVLLTTAASLPFTTTTQSVPALRRAAEGINRNQFMGDDAGTLLR